MLVLVYIIFRLLYSITLGFIYYFAYRFTTILLSVANSACNFTYIGVILFTTQLLQSAKRSTKYEDICNSFGGDTGYTFNSTLCFQFCDLTVHTRRLPGHSLGHRRRTRWWAERSCTSKCTIPHYLQLLNVPVGTIVSTACERAQKQIIFTDFEY